MHAVPPPKCLWCDAPAVRYCDAGVGVSALVSSAKSLANWRLFTCDAPMCATHTKCVSTYHVRFSRRDKFTGARGAFNSIDHCPYHVKRAPITPLTDLPTMREEEARAWRETMVAAVSLERRGLLLFPETNK